MTHMPPILAAVLLALTTPSAIATGVVIHAGSNEVAIDLDAPSIRVIGAYTLAAQNEPALCVTFFPGVPPYIAVGECNSPNSYGAIIMP